MIRKRIDLVLVDQGLAETRQKAKAMIMAGNVLVNDQLIDKPGVRITPDFDRIRLKNPVLPYVSRGGIKLKAALDTFAIKPRGWTCLDVGASTGGFTDCLLQEGAAHVFAVDVGYGQLAWKLRQNSCVTVMERTNVRHMPPEALPRKVDLITIDVSFISLTIVIPAVTSLFKTRWRLVALVKPQFEVGKGNVGKGGVVRNAKIVKAPSAKVIQFAQTKGLKKADTPIESPILGPKGNHEYLICLKECPFNNTTEVYRRSVQHNLQINRILERIGHNTASFGNGHQFLHLGLIVILGRYFH